MISESQRRCFLQQEPNCRFKRLRKIIKRSFIISHFFCLFSESKTSSADGDFDFSSKEASEVFAHRSWLVSRIFPAVLWSFDTRRSCRVVVLEDLTVVQRRREGEEDGD